MRAMSDMLAKFRLILMKIKSVLIWIKWLLFGTN